MQEMSFGNQKEETVYITDTGIVYHQDAECTYLELSIKAVSSSQIKNLRNESGGKYYACESCMKKEKQSVLYYRYREPSYDIVLFRSRLKRTVYAVPLSEVYGRGGCKRCVK